MIFVSETRTVNEEKPQPLSNYEAIYRNRNVPRRNREGGVTMYISKLLQYTEIPLHHLQTETAAIKMNNLTIIGAYIRPRTSFPENEFTALINLDNKTIIVRDLNAKHIA